MSIVPFTCERLRVLDLFAGCGGLSLGFEAAGFRLAGAIERDAVAVRSYKTNFAGSETDEELDIVGIEPGDYARMFLTGGKVDVIVGGPPCQPFARIGRAKLRAVSKNRHAFLVDSRATLYLRYLAYVEEFEPLAVLLENVPDLLNHGGSNLAEEMCSALQQIGYECSYTLLNAVNYGVPQTRQRLFVMGYRRDLGIPVEFPAAINYYDIPAGYLIRRLQSSSSLFGKRSRYVDPPPSSPDMPRAISAIDALQDLPALTEHLTQRPTGPNRRTDCRLAYDDSIRPSMYARMMREWPTHGSDGAVIDHVTRRLPRDYQTFARMAPGDQYPEALVHAERIFREALDALAAEGQSVPEGSVQWKELRRSIVPPYDATKFPNKWRKLEPDKPVRTLMAHLAKDCYSHIHYDSAQARTITIREAARLQSFPDGFVFAGSMNDAYRQIGNAVPPLLAKAIAEAMRSSLVRAIGHEERRTAGTGEGV